MNCIFAFTWLNLCSQLFYAGTHQSITFKMGNWANLGFLKPRQTALMPAS